VPENTTSIRIDRSEPGVAILELRGEHETYSTPRVEADLDALLAEGASIVVDLSTATFLDSTVVAALLRALREAESRGIGFAVVLDDTTGWSVRRLFDLTGLQTVFEVAPDRKRAIAAARAA
jgi:anti-sigma B factor antagonist